ncbi:MAG: thioredoxin [Candidatus Tritonobacter lacicola]|nr:thioredoxin [Candidatus Tritonobacter lacicola]
MNLIHVTDSDFEEKVIKAATPVLVDFGADWCGPCRLIGPLLEELAPEYEGRLTIAKLDVDKNRETAIKYGVQGIPTLILFKDGKVADQVVGALPKPKLKEWLDSKL